jgi:hypothetical protein
MGAHIAINPPLLEALAKTVSQHCVSIYVELQRGEEKVKLDHYTACLISVDGQWVIATAGHVMKAVQWHLDNGYTFKRSWRVDGVFPNSIEDFTPFPWESFQRWFIDEDGEDYGFFVVDEFTRRGLEKAGKVAASERFWDFPKLPTTPPSDSVTPSLFYMVYGFPAFALKAEELRFQATSHMWFLDPCDRPEDVREPRVETFYARARDEESVEGMSGGPVFIGYVTSAGQWMYILPAIQSHWWKDYRVIGAPHVTALARRIRAQLALR